MNECPELSQCKDRRIADAEHRGKVMAMLTSIDESIKALWADNAVQRGDIKGLYFRIGMISGGTAMVVSLIVSLVINGISK